MIKKILSFLCLWSSVAFAVEPPRLIVQIVVDQLRGDLLNQNQAHFSPNGFNYLLTHGLIFQNASHPHAHTTTCVGHATIATGSSPFLHGIIANEWFDRHSQKDTYCTDDPKSPILPSSRTQKIPEGRSPHLLLASTLSDEIVLAEKGRAFGVSLKDRAAITLAGHAGIAYWFDKENGGFVSSQHYLSAYPEWVNAWNAAYSPQNETWQLGQASSYYRYHHAVPFNNKVPSFGKTFPHQTGTPDNPLYYKHLSMMPKADELTLDFALHLLKAEKLGHSLQSTDYLAISFSVVDAIGHQFGPNSLEAEDNLLHLDKTIALLLKSLDEEVGLEHTLIVLTADHGVTDAPPYLQAKHMPLAPTIHLDHLSKSVQEVLKTNFSLPENTLQAIRLPFIYLNHDIIKAHHLSVSDVTQSLIPFLDAQKGVFKSYALPLLNTPDSLASKVALMAFAKRAGDIYIVPPPYQETTNGLLRVDHGTPWNYDSYVPLLFVNPAFVPQQITRTVHTTDIAPTLASLLHIKAPSASLGEPLQDVLSQYK